MKRKILSESTGNYRNGGRLRHLPGLNCAVVAWNRWNLCFFALRLHLRYPGSQVLEAYANANTSSRKWKTFHSLRWRLRLHLRQGGWKCKSLYLHCKACVCTYICVARLKQAFAFSSKSHTCLNEAIASISSISRFASAHVRSACVNTSGVYVTWARVCFAFVNISQKFKKLNKEKRERSKS